MARLLRLLGRNFTYATILGIGLGVFFRHELFPYRFLLPLCIGFSLFAAGLKIDLADVLLHLRRVKRTVGMLAFLLLGLPLILSFLASPLGSSYEAAALVLFALPAGLTVAPRAEFFKGDSALGLLYTTLMHLLLPFTLPFLLWLKGIKATVDSFTLFFSLAFLVASPFLLSQLTRRLLMPQVTCVWRFLTPANIFVIRFFLIPLAVSGIPDSLLTAPFGLLQAMVFWFALCLGLMALGYHFPLYKVKEERITMGLVFYHRSVSFGMVIASLYLPPEVFVIGMGFQLVLDVLALPYQHLLERHWLPLSLAPWQGPRP